MFRAPARCWLNSGVAAPRVAPAAAFGGEPAASRHFSVKLWRRFRASMRPCALSNARRSSLLVTLRPGSNLTVARMRAGGTAELIGGRLGAGGAVSRQMRFPGLDMILACPRRQSMCSCRTRALRVVRLVTMKRVSGPSAPTSTRAMMRSTRLQQQIPRARLQPANVTPANIPIA